MESKRNKSHEVLLGKYELGRLLGRGTFAKVYHARSLADGSPVAVKVLEKPSPDAAPRILREISSMRRLSHPNIIRLHEVMATRSKIYLVMDFAAGGELLNRLRRRGHLPETAARRYFHQLLSALRFSHARGVAHRDLKPQNLLLDVSGDLKLSDFGLSADLRLPLATSCGTPAYTAPEVLRGKPYDGAKADAWSCGVILFVLLSGCIPFDDANLALMYRKTQKKEYKFPPWITPPARKVIAKLLDPNPESRITLDAVADLAWYKRSFSLDQQLSLMNLPPLPRDHLLVQQSLNAFDIISMSSGLDLSGLFDGVDGARRFISTAGMEKIVERIEDAGAKLGYVMEKTKGVRLGESVVLAVEVSEVASPMLLVEMRVESGGDGERFCWGDLRAELGEIVLSWHKDRDV